ncbi:MAG: acyl-CoA dehydrogenase family protein [Myxococcaceae bacterium]|nr:acyl-CoA dehydrogenase family protein [Myxococcaceae bacterium]
MLSLGLSEELTAIQGTVREFAAKHLRPKLRAIEKNGLGADTRARFAELGLFGVDWPEAAGGQALGLITRAVIEEELAYGDVGAALALDRGGAAAQLLLALGTPDAHAALKRLLDGEGHAALAAAEEGKARDDFRTVAAKQGSGWVLNGKKAYVLGGATAALRLVLAQVDVGQGLAGAGVFLVEGANPGLRAGKTHTTLGLQAVPVHELVIEGLMLPLAARLDDQVSLPQVLRRHYDRLSLVTAARAVGLAAASYEYARAYAEERVAFGKPIGHFQAIAFLLSDMAIAVDAARLMTWKAAWAFDQRQPATADLAGAQAQALEAAFFCANSAVQVLGGAGFVQDHPVEKWMRDAKTLALYGQHAQASHAVLAAAALGRPLDSADLFPLPSLHASLS